MNKNQSCFLNTNVRDQYDRFTTTNFINSFILAALYADHMEQLRYLKSSKESHFLKVSDKLHLNFSFLPSCLDMDRKRESEAKEEY